MHHYICDRKVTAVVTPSVAVNSASSALPFPHYHDCRFGRRINC